MLLEERRRRVLATLERKESVTVAELAATLGVSSVTVRSDLDALAAAGLLLRSHGGAVRRSDVLRDLPLHVKQTLHHPQKLRIAARAAELVEEGETVLLDSGTTTLEIARRLRVRRLGALTVITNALNIALELAATPQLRLIMLGGILRPVSLSFVGPQAVQALRGLNADRAFIGVDGLDPDHGLSTPDVLEAQLGAVMMQVARQVVIVADASKLGRRSLSVIGQLARGHVVITDQRLGRSAGRAMKARGVQVVVV